MSYRVYIVLAVVVVIVSLVVCCCYCFVGKKEGFSTTLADQNLFVKLILGGKYKQYFVKNTPDGQPISVTLAHKGYVDVQDMFLPTHKKVKCSKYAIQFMELNNGKYIDRGFVKIVDNKIVMDKNSLNHTIFTFYPIRHPYDKLSSQAFIVFASTEEADFNKLLKGGKIPVLEMAEGGKFKMSMFTWNSKLASTIKTEQLFMIKKRS